jgi:hypothetical protein
MVRSMARGVEIKVHELLQKFDKEGIKRSEIAVIKVGSLADMIRNILMYLIRFSSNMRDFIREKILR